jgi:hypothetical protein
MPAKPDPFELDQLNLGVDFPTPFCFEFPDNIPIGFNA